MKWKTACCLPLLTAGLALLPLKLAQSKTNAPSFECEKALHADELAVCGSPSLSELDQLLAVGFYYIRKHSGKSPAQALARRFLAQRKSCGPNVECIQSAYVNAMTEYQHAGAPIMVPGWAILIVPEGTVAPARFPESVQAPNPEPDEPKAIDRLKHDMAKLDLERRYNALPSEIADGRVTTARVIEITLEAQKAGIVSEEAVRQGNSTGKVVLECVAQAAERADTPNALLHGATSKEEVQAEMADTLFAQCEPTSLDMPGKIAIAIGRRAMIESLYARK